MSESQPSKLCSACGQYMPKEDQDLNGYHKPSICDANEEGCQLCGNTIDDISTALIVLPWGLTCAICLKDMEDSAKKSRPTAQEIVENNKKIIQDNNLKSWQEIHNHTIKTRLENKGE
jgi:hypothetical protein